MKTIQKNTKAILPDDVPSEDEDADEENENPRGTRITDGFGSDSNSIEEMSIEEAERIGKRKQRLDPEQSLQVGSALNKTESSEQTTPDSDSESRGIESKSDKRKSTTMFVPTIGSRIVEAAEDDSDLDDWDPVDSDLGIPEDLLTLPWGFAVSYFTCAYFYEDSDFDLLR